MNKINLEQTKKDSEPIIKTLKFNVEDICFIGKNPETFENAGANWFNVRIKYKNSEGNYSFGYLKAYVDYLKLDGGEFVYSNKENSVLKIYDVVLKTAVNVPYNIIENYIVKI